MGRTCCFLNSFFLAQSWKPTLKSIRSWIQGVQAPDLDSAAILPRTEDLSPLDPQARSWWVPLLTHSLTHSCI